MQKQISILVGIIIIVAVAVLAFGGVFAWQYFIKSQTPAQDSNTETAGPAPSEVEGWKTYRNDEYGFEIKYPNEFTRSVSEKARSVGVLFYGQNSEKLAIRFNIDDNFNQDYLTIGRNSVEYKKSEIMMDGVKSYKVKSASCYMGCGTSVAIFIPVKENKVINLRMLRTPDTGWSTDSEAPKITDQEEEIFNQMLSTFKFIK